MRTLILISLLLLPAVVSAQTGWRKEGGEGAWAKRTDHNTESYDGRLLVFNGRGASGGSSDLWSSINGIDWFEELSNLPWYTRNRAASTVFDNRLWMMGGWWVGSGENMSDVWSTVDGMNWTQETPAAAWLGRQGHQAVSFNGKLWVLGGGAKIGSYLFWLNDVWSSPDGVNWNLEINAAAWPGRMFHRCVVFKGRIWVMGGVDGVWPGGGFKNDVWSSADGINWTQETAAAPWEPRVDFTATVYGERIWVIGGYEWTDLNEYGDVWSSVDGKNWRYEGQPWSVRYLHESVVFNGRLWVIGGVDAVTFPGDVWSLGVHVRDNALPPGRVLEPYSAQIEALGGEAPLTWTMISGELPPGVTLGVSDSHYLPISGTPESAGTYQFTLRIEEANGDSIEETVTLLIRAQRPFAEGKSNKSGCALAGAWAFGPYVLVIAAPAIAAYALSRRRRRGWTFR